MIHADGIIDLNKCLSLQYKKFNVLIRNPEKISYLTFYCNIDLKRHMA